MTRGGDNVAFNLGGYEPATGTVIVVDTKLGETFIASL